MLPSFNPVAISGEMVYWNNHLRGGVAFTRKVDIPMHGSLRDSGISPGPTGAGHPALRLVNTTTGETLGLAFSHANCLAFLF
jgi:hypothetical protein